MSAGRISDRHSRVAAGLVPASDMQVLRVRVSSRSAASSVPGQHMLVCLVNLLARLAGSVGEIVLDLPTVPVMVRTPHATTERELTPALLSLARWAVGDEVTVFSEPGTAADDVQLCVGDDVESTDCGTVIYALGEGWRAWAGIRAHLPQHAWRPGASECPLGPYFAAAMIAGEVFKRARGLTKGRFLQSLGYSLWSGEIGEWEDLADGPDLGGTALPPLYLVGAGAVGQGLIQIVGAAEFASAYIVTLDDDQHDETNLNRCFLAGTEDVGKRKVDAVARYRKRSGFGGLDFFGTLREYVQVVKPDLAGELKERERDDRYDIVVSCVDKGTSRQDIQGLWPDLIFGGSTLGLTAKTNVYARDTKLACLACHNPPEQDGEIYRRIEQEIRGLSREEQIARLRGKVKNLPAVLEYLDSSDGCGSAGEAEFKEFATASTREFSASFISMASAVLLAARVFGRLSAENQPMLVRDGMTILSFGNLRVEDCRLAKDANCLRCAG